MALIQWFVAVAGIGAMGTLSLRELRMWFQRRADHMRMTYELSFPAGMTHDHVLAFDRSLGGLPPPRFLRPVHAPVFELYATNEGFRYFLHIPGHVDPRVDILLEDHIEGIRLEEVEDDPVANTIWTGSEIYLSGRNAQLNVEDVVNASRDIRAGFKNLLPGEAVMMQWIIWPARHATATPENKTKLSDIMFNASFRIGASGDYPERLLKNIHMGLRRVGRDGAAFRRMPTSNVGGKISRRAGHLAYQIYINALELSVLKGWPLDGSAGKGMPKTLPASPMHQPSGIVIGIADHHKSSGHTITLPADDDDINGHVRITGQSGTGKSNLLLTITEQWMQRPDTAVILLAPEEGLPRQALNHVPAHRVRDVIYFNPLDTDYPLGFNPFEGSDPERITSHIVSILKNLSGDSWGPQLQRVLTTAVKTTALLGLTLYDTKQLLVNKEYRSAQLRRLKRSEHPEIFQEWDWIDGKADLVVDSSVNRLDSFLSSSMLRNILVQRRGLNFDRIIREHKILLVPLPAARMGETNAATLGQLVREMAWNAAMRQDPDNYQRSVVIMDEFQNYADQSTNKSDPYAEARKYKQRYYLAHQFSNQVPKNIQDTVDNNVATQIAFRADFKDAKLIAPRFSPMADEDIEKIPKYHAVGRINTVAGVAPPVTFVTPSPTPETGFAQEIIENTRRLYTKPVSEVEADILTRHKPKDPPKKPEIG